MWGSKRVKVDEDLVGGEEDLGIWGFPATGLGLNAAAVCADPPGVAQKITSFEKVLRRDLKLMRHRQVIHPVLQEGRKPPASPASAAARLLTSSLDAVQASSRGSSGGGPAGVRAS